MKFQLITGPTVLPLTLAEVKNHLKIDTDLTEDDAWVFGAIRAAVDRCEAHTKRCLMTQTWSIWFDRFMAGQEPWWDGVRDGALSELTSCKRYIELNKAPVQSVSHVKTYDDSDVSYTMSTADYMVDSVSVPARLALRNGKTWPATVLRPLNGIEVQVICGYGSNLTDVPQSIRQDMLADIADLYEHRGDSTIPNLSGGLYDKFVVKTL
jgi:hypothetical protein